MTHICVGKLTIIGSDIGLSPGWRQAIIWTNAGILLIGPLGTNFSEILFGIQTFSFKKMHLKMSSGKWRPFCLGLNVLRDTTLSSGSLFNIARFVKWISKGCGHGNVILTFFCDGLHRKFPQGQRPVQSVTTYFFSKWRHLCFSGCI